MPASSHISRRSFLKTTSAGAVSAMLAGYSGLAHASRFTHSGQCADRMIFLWMGGGMPHTETFDPKSFTPYSSGMQANSILSTFSSIDTNVDTIKISSGLENIAKVMDECLLLRGYAAPDLGFVLHSCHQHCWMTGHVPSTEMKHPHFGSLLAERLGPIHADVPAFIQIGSGIPMEPVAYGVEPVALPYPAIEGINPLSLTGDSTQRSQVDAWRRLAGSPRARVFDFNGERQSVLQQYDTGEFGRSCLLARRLVEHGARFVQVNCGYEPFKLWDTHENGHERVAAMKQAMDAPVAQLILDLKERGLLKHTLVVLASEFSRDMLTEGKSDSISQPPSLVMSEKHYGMHKHFTDAGTVLMFGGGVQGGAVIGKTADERPCRVVSDPLGIGDIHALICDRMGSASDSRNLADASMPAVSLNRMPVS